MNVKVIKTAPIFISVFAVVLSQFQPLHMMLAKPDISLRIGREAHLFLDPASLVLGTANVIYNFGSARGTVRDIDIYLVHESDTELNIHFPSQSYVSEALRATKTGIIPAVEFSFEIVDPNTAWKRNIQSREHISDVEEEKINSFSERYANEIESAVNSIPVAAGIDYVTHLNQISASTPPTPKLSNDIQNFMYQSIGTIQSGLYYLYFTAQDEQGRVLDNVIYSFNLSESKRKRLMSGVAEASRGFGLLAHLPPIGHNSTVVVNLERIMNRLTEAKIRNRLGLKY